MSQPPQVEALAKVAEVASPSGADDSGSDASEDDAAKDASPAEDDNGSGASKDDGAPEDASPAGDDDGASEDNGALKEASPSQDDDGSDSNEDLAFLEDLVVQARSMSMEDSKDDGGHRSKRRLDFGDDHDDDEVVKDSAACVYTMYVSYMIGFLQDEKEGAEFVPSSFKASGLPAGDISRVQKAALESVKHAVLTPEQQLDLIKSELAKKAKAKPKKRAEILGWK